MIEKSLIDHAINNYRKLKSVDSIIIKKKSDIIQYCEGYIKSIYPKEIFNLIPRGFIKAQQDINFRQYAGPLRLAVEKHKLESSYSNYFNYGFLDIDLRSKSMPVLFTSSYGEINPEFLRNEKHKDFSKILLDKINDLIETSCNFADEMEAIRKVLSLGNMTLRELKSNYIELYNLIKN